MLSRCWAYEISVCWAFFRIALWSKLKKLSRGIKHSSWFCYNNKLVYSTPPTLSPTWSYKSIYMKYIYFWILLFWIFWTLTTYFKLERSSQFRTQPTHKNKTKQKTTPTRKRQTNNNNNNNDKTANQKQTLRQQGIQAVGLNEIRTYDSLSFRRSLGVRREEISAEGEGEEREVSLPSLSPLSASFFAFSPRNSLYSC